MLSLSHLINWIAGSTLHVALDSWNSRTNLLSIVQYTHTDWLTDWHTVWRWAQVFFGFGPCWRSVWMCDRCGQLLSRDWWMEAPLEPPLPALPCTMLSVCVACVFRYFDCFGYSRNVLGCSPDRQRERESESKCYIERERKAERASMRKSGRGRVGSCRLILLFCFAGGATRKQFQFGFATGPMGQVRAQQQQQQQQLEEAAQ